MNKKFIWRNIGMLCLIAAFTMVFGLNANAAKLKSCKIKGKRLVVIKEGATKKFEGSHNSSEVSLDQGIWEVSDDNYLKVEKSSKSSATIRALKHTGSQKKIKLTYTAVKEGVSVQDSIDVIVEGKTTLTADQIEEGKRTTLYAPIYEDYIASYKWEKSIDCGKTWKKIENAKSSCYTTDTLTLDSESWRIKCIVTIKIDKGDEKGVVLDAEEFSFASLRKKIPTFKVADKQAIYTGSPISINEPMVEPRTLIQNVSYEYYTDVKLSKLTTSANGAKTIGGAPANVGKYYVVVNLKESEDYRGASHRYAVLDITKAKGQIEVKNSKISLTAGVTSTVAITKNFGNPSFKVESSDSSILTVAVKNGKIVCNPKGAGDCKVMVTTSGNANVEAASTEFDVEISPAKIALKSVKSKKKHRLDIKIKLDKTASGYEVEFAKKKNFSRGYKSFDINKKLRNNKIKIYDLSLKSKKKYYVHVRAYYGTNTNKRFGPWSNAKRVKVK